MKVKPEIFETKFMKVMQDVCKEAHAEEENPFALQFENTEDSISFSMTL